MVRLDHLEALVHEGRRVDRDLRPHRPGRVRAARRRASTARELIGRARPRNGPPEAVRIAGRHPLARHARQELEQGRVLGVDRHQRGAGARPRGGDEVAAGHQALLVGQRHGDAALERGQRGPQARRARPARSARGRARAASIRPARSGSWGTVPPPAAQAVWATPWAAAWAAIAASARAAGEPAGHEVGRAGR